MHSDTDPRVEKVLVDLLRKANPRKRLARIGALSATVRNLSRRAIARANPSLSQRELDVLFVEYHYGPELARKFRLYLERIPP